MTTTTDVQKMGNTTPDVKHLYQYNGCNENKNTTDVYTMGTNTTDIKATDANLERT
jgi:hypothetical protein